MTQEKENGAGVNGATDGQKKIWMTLTGLPLTFALEWPFHKSTSGADFWVLHGDIRLENSDGLHAPVAVNLSETVREVLPTLDPKDVEIPAINALRKEVDRRQIEFLKSGKLLPVAFSSRHYDFKRQRWVFGKTTDETIEEFVERKVYWQTRLGKSTGNPARVWIADPAEAQYLQTSTETLLGAAARLAAKGLLRVDGEYAEANDALMALSRKFETAMRESVEALEKKHAYERG